VLSYAVVTPVRNEADNLRRLAGCLAEQTVAPAQWLLVDNGSTDDTLAVASELAHRHSWIRVIAVGGVGAPAPGAPVVRAFNAGLEALDQPPDAVAKLDADISVDPDHFERLLDAFRSDPSLGIAGGSCLELDGNAWREYPVSSGHVRGGARVYRWGCLAELRPLEESVGWDGIDQIKARLLGWTTSVVPGVVFRHHRRLGERDGAPHRRWLAQGAGAYYMGYRFPYLALRAAHRALTEPVALAMIPAYLAASLRRRPRSGDVSVRAWVRDQQRIRNLASWARDGVGTRAADPGNARSAESLR
jgi:poly-beta-1,6-N-acetyl-D-glucosamine synthase